MDISLDLRQLCIETASQKKYEHLIRQYFKTKPFDPKKIILERQISALKYFLEKTDFQDLRNRFNRSSPIEKKAILIIPQPLEKMYVWFNKTIFYPVWKNK